MMQNLLRSIPKMDALLLTPRGIRWAEEYGRSQVLEAFRQTTHQVREEMLAGSFPEGEEPENRVLNMASGVLQGWQQMNFRQVINATGIVLHTNLGRAVLPEKACQAILVAASGYSNLELELETGKRGSRYSHVIRLLQELTGCEDAMVVNNNAAAVLLALDTLARGGETVVSRGELVEIGGSFRVPEVMKAGGTRLVEVGTTNKTHLRDYEEVLGPETRAILKVHTSNYRVLGFCQTVPTEELVELGHRSEIPVIEDLGSGFLADLSAVGITDEPRVQDVVKKGVDVITFSGDKLLGGPQAGIIIGKKEYLERMRKNQLTRALRIDKLSIAALEATLSQYRDMERVCRDNPTLAMLSVSQEELEAKARELADLLGSALPAFSFVVEPDRSQAGGGSLPLVELPTWVVRIQGGPVTEEELSRRLRAGNPAVMGRKQKETLVLDVRTLKREEFPLLTRALIKALDGEDQ